MSHGRLRSLHDAFSFQSGNLHYPAATTQLMELGIPVAIAVNMMDVVEKNGDQIHTAELSRALGCRVVEISALKGKHVHSFTSLTFISFN